MATKTVGQFVLTTVEGLMPELHASGCRDLHGFNENPIVAESAAAALEALIENGTISKETKIRVMPCTNPVRMRAINRLFEVDTETGAPVAPEPTAKDAPEPASTEPVAEEPKLSKKERRAAAKAAKAAAKAAETTEEVAVA